MADLGSETAHSLDQSKSVAYMSYRNPKLQLLNLTVFHSSKLELTQKSQAKMTQNACDVYLCLQMPEEAWKTCKYTNYHHHHPSPIIQKK